MANSTKSGAAVLAWQAWRKQLATQFKRNFELLTNSGFRETLQIMGLEQYAFSVAVPEAFDEILDLYVVARQKDNPILVALGMKDGDVRHLSRNSVKSALETGRMIVVRDTQQAHTPIVSVLSEIDLCDLALSQLVEVQGAPGSVAAKWNELFHHVLKNDELIRARGHEPFYSILTCADLATLREELIPKHYGTFSYGGYGTVHPSVKKRGLMFVGLFLFETLSASLELDVAGGGGESRCYKFGVVVPTNAKSDRALPVFGMHKLAGINSREICEFRFADGTSIGDGGGASVLGKQDRENMVISLWARETAAQQRRAYKNMVAANGKRTSFSAWRKSPQNSRKPTRRPSCK